MAIGITKCFLLSSGVECAMSASQIDLGEQEFILVHFSYKQGLPASYEAQKAGKIY